MSDIAIHPTLASDFHAANLIGQAHGLVIRIVRGRPVFREINSANTPKNMVAINTPKPAGRATAIHQISTERNMP